MALYGCEAAHINKQVFQQLIDRQLLLNMAESLNLRATDLEVQEYIRQQPYFQKNGQFDFETYETLLSQNRLPTEEYEESVRLDLLLQKKQQLLTAGIIISERDVEQRFQLQNEKLEVRTLQLLPRVFLDEVSVSEEQAQQYYQENPDEFQTLPRYRLAYFTVGINDLMKQCRFKHSEISHFGLWLTFHWTNDSTILLGSDMKFPRLYTESKYLFWDNISSHTLHVSFYATYVAVLYFVVPSTYISTYYT